MKKITSFIKKHCLIIILVLISSVIFLTNLSGQDYSLDEPETVVLARSIAKYGFPSPWDGQNLVSTNNGKDVIVIGNYYFWQWQPWFQHYLVFSGINIFGDNLFGQRFFFSLFGIATIFLMYLLSKELFKNKYVSFFVSLQLVFLLPFFLYIRSVRYYSPSAFFSLLVFYLTIINLKNKWNRKYSIIFFLAGLLLFFSNYLVWLASLTFFLITLIFKKRKEILYLSVIQILVAIIWFLIFKPYSGDVLVFNQLKSFLVNHLKNISYVNNFIFPIVLVPFLFFINKINKKFILVLVGLIIFKILIYSIFLIPHGRYLVDVFPVFILLFGYFYDYLICKKKIVLFFLLFFFVTFTNILNILPYYVFAKEKIVFNFYPQKYYIELTGKYRNTMPYKITNYLKLNYKKGDLFISNGYPWYIYSYSNVPSASLICNKEKNTLSGPLEITKKDKIRWIILFPFNKYSFPCLDFMNVKDLEKTYRLVDINLNDNTYLTNDVDIFNRQFPPLEIGKDEVLLFEKR